jgi:hypothetical protein
LLLFADFIDYDIGIRVSSATAPHLLDPDRHGGADPVRLETPQLPMRSFLHVMRPFHPGRRQHFAI